MALLYLCFLVERMLHVPPAVFVELQLALRILAVFGRGVIAPVAFRALQSYKFKVFRFAFGHLGLPAGS
jgi:hypothetical protein